MKYVLVNYNFDPSWVKEYTDDYLIYDRSDSDEWVKDIPKDRIIKTKNIGNVDYDRLTYLIDFYDELPNVFVLAKTNLFKYITKEEFDKIKNRKKVTPLLTQKHKTYLPTCLYKDKMYYEINNSWYLNHVPAKYYKSFGEFTTDFGIPNPDYIPFPPGGNMIVTKKAVHRYPKSFYERMRSKLDYSQLPGEAHFVERAYYLLWS